MAEKSENEASKTGQNETPETEQDVEKSKTSAETREGQTEASGYRESEEHVPDPTAMSGTLETSGTGGGVNERLTGTTRIFGDIENLTQRVESLIATRVQSLSEEVRGLLLQQEARAQAQNVPQQTVEEHGLPSHQGNIIAPGDDSGAAKDANRSANVGAGSPDDVSAGTTRVEDPAKGDSYVQQNVAGARNPQDYVQQVTDHVQQTLGGRSESKDEGSEETSESEEKSESKTPAKKTTARRNSKK